MSSDRPTDNRPAHGAAALLRALSDTRLAAGVRSRLRRARRIFDADIVFSPTKTLIRHADTGA